MQDITIGVDVQDGIAHCILTRHHTDGSVTVLKQWTTTPDAIFVNSEIFHAHDAGRVDLLDANGEWIMELEKER